MADRTERLTISVQGAAELAALRTAAAAARQELANLEAQLASLKAAQAHVQAQAPGTMLPPAQMRAAVGGAEPDLPKLDAQMATAQKEAIAKVAAAKKALNDADKASAQFIAQQNRALTESIALMAKSTNAADREWAAQQRLNQQRQRGQELSRQLGLPSAGEFGPAGLAGRYAGNQGAGMAARAVSMGASQLGGMSGMPGAGLAAQVLSGAIEGLSVPIIGAIGMGLAGLAVALGANTIQSTLSGYGLTLGGSVALGNAHNARSQYTQAILQQGSDFSVPVAENTANAQAMGQIGVSAQDIAGNQSKGIPSALALGYAVATNAGMELAQGTQMVAEYMVKTGATVSQASLAFQRYALAADAAGISLQRVFSIMQQVQALGENQDLNAGQMASMQAQLGQGFNVAQIMAGPLTATGFQAVALQSMLGISSDQLTSLQSKNPAKLMDPVTQKAQSMSGGNYEVTEGILQQAFGETFSGLTPEQQKTLATAKPGQFMSYYNQFVRSGANRATVPTNTMLSTEARNRRDSLTAADRGKTALGYTALTAGEGKGVATGALRVVNGQQEIQTPSGWVPLTGEASNTLAGKSPAQAQAMMQSAIQAAQQIQLGVTGSQGQVARATLRSMGLSVTPDAITALQSKLPAAAHNYAADYLVASQLTGVPISVLAAQDQIESSYSPTAANGQYLGLGQLSSDARSQYGVTNAFNPTQNIMGTALMDKDLLSQFKNVQAMFSAYNEGAGTYQKSGVTDPGYLSKIDAALQMLTKSGVDVNVTVTVKDSSGHIMPSTSQYKKAPTTSPTRPPGHVW